MSCRGVHFALDETTAATLKSFWRDSSRLRFVQEAIEETWFDQLPEWYAETDKAWDAIHRALTDGSLSWDGGTYPLNQVILGGRRIYRGKDYIMSLKTPAQVRDIANSIDSISHDRFRAGYFAIDAADYGCPMSEEDLNYAWEWFEPLIGYFQRSADVGRYVLFTADQ